MSLALTLLTGLASASIATTTPPFDSPGPRSHWEPLVQPATHTSPGGAFRCHVRSLARDWRAGGHVQVEHSGEVVFERDLPVAPWGVAVLDDGRTVLVGFRANEATNAGDLVVVALGPDGELAWEHTEPRQAVVIGLTSRPTYKSPRWVVEAEAGEVLVELNPTYRRSDTDPTCRVLRLADGGDLGRRQRGFPASTAPTAAPGVGPELTVPTLEALPPLPLELPEPDAVDAALPESLTKIQAIGFDDAGSVGVLSTYAGAVVARSFDRAGRSLAAVRFEKLDFELDYRCRVSSGAGGAWLVATPGDHRVLRLDPARGVAELVRTHEQPIEALLGFRDGGFALLESRGWLRCFDAEGRPCEVETTGDAPNAADAEKLEYHLLGRSATGDGIAVASPGDDSLRLTLLSDGGRTWRHVAPPFDPAAGLDPYGDAVLQTRAGSFWLATDGTMRSTLVERDLAGKVLRRIEPRLADGSEFPFARGTLEVAPDGTLASSNAHLVATYSLSGEPSLVLGRRCEPLAWNYPRRWSVWPDGRIAVVAGYRAAVLLDAEGRNGVVLRAPNTYHDSDGELQLDGSGVTWWHLGPFDPFARYDAAGGYLGVQRLGEDELHVRFIEEATERWSTDSREVVRVDASGTALETHTTRPDGAWWRDIKDLVASPDGRRLVVADVLRAGGRDEGGFLAIYDYAVGAAWYVDGPKVGDASLAGDWVTWGRTLVHLPTRTVLGLPDDLRVVTTPRGPELWQIKAPELEGPVRRFEVQRFAMPALGR